MRAGSTAGRGGAGAAAVWLALAAAGGGAAAARGTGAAQSGVISREAALAAVFDGADIAAGRVYLTPAQADRVAELARGEVPTMVYARYVATRGGGVVGRAYVDTHVVRTKRESLLISLDADGRVRRIDVTAFLEPPEYLAPGRWRDQYLGQPLGDDLAVHRAIRPMAGATLTALAVNEAVRRVLALDLVLEGREPAGR